MQTPESLEQLVEWWPMMRRLGLRQGVPDTEVEDFVAQVTLEFIRGEYLSKYNPDIATFSSFIGAFTVKRAMAHRDRHYREISRREAREIKDEPEEDEPGIYLSENPFEDFEGNYEFQELWNELKKSKVLEVVLYRQDIGGGKVKVTRVERSLFTLFQMLVAGLTQREIAKIYGRSLGTVNNMVNQLRQNEAVLAFLIEKD